MIAVHMKIDSKTARAVIKNGLTIVLFESKKGNKNRKLEDYPIIKIASGEKILYMERQHPISYLAPMLTRITFAVFLLLLSIYLPQFANIMTSYIATPTLIAYLVLTIISVFFLIEIFSFLSWYYHIYIITNKALIQRFCFRIVGEFSEAVFGEKMHVQDVVRLPSNIIYDFLKIQDVYVYFHKQEREDPFVFTTPQDAQRIEDIIQDLITQTRNNPIT